MGKWFFHLSMKQRILLYFVFVLTLVIALTATLIYHQAATEIKKHAESYLEHIVENTSYQTDRYIRNLELSTLSLLTNRRIQEYLDLEEDQHFEKFIYYNDILREMNRVQVQHEDIELIYLFGENKYILSDSMATREEHLAMRDRYASLINSTPESGRVSLLAMESLYSNNYVISLNRRVRGAESFIPKGILGIEINASAMDQLWKLTELNKDTNVWIVGEDGKIVYYHDESWLGNKIDEETFAKFQEEEKGSFSHYIDGEEVLLYFNKSKETGWTLLATTPVTTVLEPVSGIKRSAIFVSSIALLIAIAISTQLAKNIVIPVQKVQMGMKKMETGEWEKIKPLRGTDEMSSMVNSYNIMVERLSQLVEDLYKSELRNQKFQIEKQKTELQALQSQINPHFLHNTLETMNAYAVLNDADEISEMAEALSNMFRYSIRNFEVVTLEHEINHIKNFLIVQEHRFQKKINVIFDIEPEVLKEDIAKLTLQPIVENAIHHGLRKSGYEGDIIIKGETNEDFLTVKVIDHGEGITEERLKEINDKLDNYQSENANMGIGVTNVHRRIQLIFGQEYGLTISGEKGKGTIVTMTIPRKSKYKGSA